MDGAGLLSDRLPATRCTAHGVRWRGQRPPGRRLAVLPRRRGRLAVPLYRTYTLDEIRIAHADMEANNATGKLVVLP